MIIRVPTPVLPQSVSEDICLSSISPKDKPWDIHRLQAEDVAKLYEFTNYQQYSGRMKQCALRLGFALVALEDEEGVFKLKLRSARFCRVRHCPICQWRRSLMWRARFFKTLPRILGDYPNHRYIFLTLTQGPPCPLSELRSTITWMNQGWKRLTQRKIWPGAGWVKTVEVTRRPGDLCHPHFHAVVMVKASYFTHNYIPKEGWRELWGDCLRVDYLPVVNVKAVRSKLKIDNFKDALMDATTETIKYSIKPDDILSKDGEDLTASQWLEGITEQLQNTRAIAIGGIFKDYLSEEEPEDLIHIEDDSLEVDSSIEQIYFGWRERLSKYVHEGD